MSDVFISYSRRDKDFVKTLHVALSQCDRDSWVDWEDIPLTADWWQEIEHGIEAANTFVFVISPDSIASKVCTQEVEHATKHNKRLVPIVRREGFDTKLAHPALRKHNWLFCRESDDFDQAFKSLIMAIDLDLEHVHTHTRLLVRAIEWDTKGRDESFLLRGSDLKGADHWLTESVDKQPEPTQLQTQYIFASGKAEIRRQRRTAIASTIGFMGAIVLAVLAFTQYRQAEQRRIEAEKGQILALSASAKANLASNQDIDALIDGIKLGQQLQRVDNLDGETQKQAITALQQVVYGARERNRLEGHSDFVRQVLFNQDGKTLVTTSDDGTVKFWKPDGTLLRTFRGHSGYVYSVSLSPDGKTVATSSWIDDSIRLWNRDEKLIRTLKRHQDDVFDVQFSPDGRLLASASFDHTVKLWNAQNGKLLKTFKGHYDTVAAVRFSPNGQLLATSSVDRTIKLWKLDGTLLQTLTGHREGVNSISFSPDGKTIASASADKTVKLWQVEDGTLLRTFKGHTEWVGDISFSPDGKTLATAGGDKTIKLWKLDGTVLATLKGHNDWISSVRFSPDGRTLASSSGDGTVKLWQLKNDLLLTLQGHDRAIGGLAFSPDGQILETGDGLRLMLWRRSDGKLLKMLTPHAGGTYDVAPTFNQTLFATTGGDKTIKLWKWDGSFIKTLARLDQPIAFIDFSRDGQTIAALSSENQTLTIWKLDGTRLQTIKGPPDWSNWSEISPDLQTVATADGDKVKLWRQDGTQRTILKGHRADITAIRFSYDSQTIATASWDRTIKLWSLDGKLITTLKGHTAGVNRIFFSQNGQLIVSSGSDNTVRLWKLDGTLLMTLETTSLPVGTKISPDGKTIAFGSDTIAVLWNIADRESPSALIHNGCLLLQDYLISHPKVLMDLESCQNPTNLLAAAANLATDDVKGAAQLLRRAVQQNPKLTLNPEAEAEKFAAPAQARRLVEAGEDLARDGNLSGAVEQLQQALKLDPKLALKPEAYAQELAAQGKAKQLIENGRNLARQGNLTAAIANFKQAVKLHPDLAIEPEPEARFHRADGLLTQANGMIQRGEIKPAIALFNQAEALKTPITRITQDWNYLCGSGSIQGYAANVMEACEKAVARYPENGEYRDSRGTARAMIGDFVGAIDDFQAFVNWTEEDDRKAMRQHWIKQLQHGQNPFTLKERRMLLEKEIQ